MHEQRTCSACGELKPMDEFYARRRRGRVERRYECKVCTKTRLARLPAANCKPRKPRPYSRWKWIKFQYGLTRSQYEALLAAQGGGCALCGAEAGTQGEALHVDHCHDSQKVRGILCSRCNRGLGYFEDDPRRLLDAASYLATPPAASVLDL